MVRNTIANVETPPNVAANVVAIGQTAKLALCMYLISNWRAPWARIVLVGLLAR